MGMISFALRIGSISAPLVIMVQGYFSWLPSTVYVLLGLYFFLEFY